MTGAGAPDSRQVRNHTIGQLHPNNPYGRGYDFPVLVRTYPELARFLRPHPQGGDTIDYNDAEAVQCLNQALMCHSHGLTAWRVPSGHLCPAIPGRVDYLCHLSDLLSRDLDSEPIKGIQILDIGTGATCVYPLLAATHFGWKCVATESNADALAWARKQIDAHPRWSNVVECRHQLNPNHIFSGVAKPDEKFSASLCNPPFYLSLEDAQKHTRLGKETGELSKDASKSNSPARSQSRFGGTGHELWFDGGETGFIQRMIRESQSRPDLCVWFTTLVARQGNLPPLEKALRETSVEEWRVLPLFAGQKQSRILAWSFLSPEERKQRLAPSHP